MKKIKKNNLKKIVIAILIAFPLAIVLVIIIIGNSNNRDKFCNNYGLKWYMIDDTKGTEYCCPRDEKGKKMKVPNDNCIRMSNEE